MTVPQFVTHAWKHLASEYYRGQYELRPWLLGPLMSPWRRGQVVMFHVGRSGSTVVSDLLNQHRDVYWDGEIYETRVFWSYSYDRVPPDLTMQARELLPRRMRRSGRRFYGFEVKFFHLDLVHQTLPDFLDDLRSLDFRHFIVLRRRNLLRKVVSSLIAHEEWRFHVKGGSRSGLRRIRLDPDRVCIDRQDKPLVAFLEDFTERFEELDRLLEREDALHLTFEEDVKPDPRRAYGKVCEYMGLEPEDVDVRYGRTNPAPVSELITNVDDVRVALRGTPFAWMLDS